MSLGAFAAFFTALLGVYFLGLKAHWFPIQHAYADDLAPGFNWTFIKSAVRHADCRPGDPWPRTRRLGAEHANGDGEHDQRGLRRGCARQGVA